MKRLFVLLSTLSLAPGVAAQTAPAATLTVFTTYKKANAEAIAADYNAQLAQRKATPVTFKFIYASNEDAEQQIAQMKNVDALWLANTYFLGKLAPELQYAAPTGLQPSAAQPLPSMKAGYTWLPLSVRTHGLLYNTDKLEAASFPKTMLDLPKVSRLKGRIGWAANTPSFTDLVAAMIAQYGVDTTRQWLTDMQKLEPRDYGSEMNGLSEAVNAGDIDVALTLSSNATRLRGNAYHTSFYTFAPQDAGNAAEYSGIAALKGPHQAQALAFARYLTLAAPQLYISTVGFDQPLYVGSLVPATAISKDYAALIPTAERMQFQQKAIALFEELGLW